MHVLMHSIRSRHTSGRTFLCPYGLQWHDFVGVGNILATRCILLVLVASWRKLRWILEQPLGSCMEDPPRFQWLLSLLKVGVFLLLLLVGFFSGPIRINLRYVSSFGHIFSKSHVTVLNMFRPTMYGESMMISLM